MNAIRCTLCGGDLDTGFRCTTCGTSALRDPELIRIGPHSATGTGITGSNGPPPKRVLPGESFHARKKP